MEGRTRGVSAPWVAPRRPSEALRVVVGTADEVEAMLRRPPPEGEIRGLAPAPLIEGVRSSLGPRRASAKALSARGRGLPCLEN